MKIALFMLTYNAPRYVMKSIWGIKKTKNVDYELIVVDNHSGRKTRALLFLLRMIGLIDKLHYNAENAYFARGNNIASSFASKDVTHYLLINSDVEIKEPNWLQKLTEIHPENGGISSFGACLTEPVRADGYCMLIDKWLYDKYMLDVNYEWWWSVTKLQSHVLEEGYRIRAVKNHESYLHHFGGASGKGYVDAKGLDTDVNEARSWFANKKNSVEIVEKI